MEKKFRKGEVVWAKVRGFPWWPAMVKGINTSIRRQADEGVESESKETNVLAYFIGDDSHADLPVSKIEKFNSKFEEFSKIKKRALIKSIEIAKNIISGEIPFEKHLLYSKKRTKFEADVGEDKIKAHKDISAPSTDKDYVGTLEEDDKSIEKEIINPPKKLLGKKLKRKVETITENFLTNNNFQNNSHSIKTHHQIDLCVKEDLNQNIKINININLNNNTNNTLNITTVGGKQMQDEKSIQINNINNNLYRKQNEDLFTEMITRTNDEEKESILNEINKHKSIKHSDLNNENIQIRNTKMRKIINDDSIVDGEESEEFSKHSNTSHKEALSLWKEELQDAIKSLLFYKIEMPASSSTRSIIGSLEMIENKLKILKNCNIYLLIKDLIPILNSFVYNKNPTISTKSSILVSVIKEKVLSEIFEFENEKDEMTRLLAQDLEENLIKDHTITNFLNKVKITRANNFSGFSKKKFGMYLDRSDTGSALDEINNKFRRVKRLRSFSNLDEDKNYYGTNLNLKNESTFKSRNLSNSEEKLTKVDQNYFERVESNNLITSNDLETFIASSDLHTKNQKKSDIHPHSNKNINLEVLNKKKVAPIDSYHMKLLFKDFLDTEMRDNTNADINEQLNNGIYSENFYQGVYNKYNGLSETLANKRKHVCLKLLNILKLILPGINTDTLKKTIIYIEYKIRTNDPTLGNIYKKKLESFYDRLKEILALTQESIDLNIKGTGR